MESKKSSSISDGDYTESSSVDILNEKKRKLEEEIKDLSNTLQQLKEFNVTANRNLIANVSGIGNEVTPSDIQFELYKYGGLCCMKSNKDQKVIGINSSTKEQHENEFAIQFIKEEENVKIGKWVMPKSVGIEQLLREVPLTSMRNIIHFIRNCKQHTDCYESRLQQFKELKSFADNLKNCTVQTNLGYTFITLELLRVYDKKNSSYFDLSISLWYNSRSARPAIIKFEVPPTNSISSTETEKNLKKSLKVFRFNDLRTAFNNIFNGNNAEFIWERTEKEDDVVEVNESSSSLDEEILVYRRLPQKRKIKKKQKIKLKKQNNKKKKVDSNSNDSNNQDATLKEINKPINSKIPSEVTSNVVKSTLPPYQSTLDKFIKKLRITSENKDNFKSIENKYNIKPAQVVVQKLTENYTSTPIKTNWQSKTPFKSLPSIDISTIGIDISYE